MQRSSLKASNMAGGISLQKPPKPPCWRDFVDQGPAPHSKDQIKAQDYGESSKAYCIKSSTHDSSEVKSTSPHSQGGSRAGRALRRVRARLRRTRSQHVIDEEDLPELTMTLAETKPQELRNRQVLDDRLLREETTRRCQSWLESIEACEPLDEIAYTQAEGSEGVDVEVPEETRWSEEGEPLRPPFNTSASSSEDEEDYEVYHNRESMPAVSASPSGSQRSDKLRSSSAKSMHDRLIRKKTLSFCADAGLE